MERRRKCCCKHGDRGLVVSGQGVRAYSPWSNGATLYCTVLYCTAHLCHATTKWRILANLIFRQFWCSSLVNSNGILLKGLGPPIRKNVQSRAQLTSLYDFFRQFSIYKWIHYNLKRILWYSSQLKLLIEQLKIPKYHFGILTYCVCCTLIIMCKV